MGVKTDKDLYLERSGKLSDIYTQQREKSKVQVNMNNMLPFVAERGKQESLHLLILGGTM